MRARDQRGAGTVVTATVALLVCGAMVVGVWVAGWVGCARRARAAADLAALSGAAAALSGGDGCRVAGGVARRNGAEVTSCRIDQADGQVVLRLQVRLRLAPAVRGGPSWVLASSTAGRTAG